jgi:Zn-dependent peptidase ImmA (M78 family)
MIFLSSRFRAYGWNKRAFTEEDVLRICRRERIELVDYPTSGSLGFYMTCRGRHFITVDSRLRGVRRLYVLLHELAHHFLHAPPGAYAAHFFRLRPDSKQEYEAEVFAAVALLPEPLLRRIIAEGGDFEGEGFTRDVVEFRLKVLDRYGV